MIVENITNRGRPATKTQMKARSAVEAFVEKADGGFTIAQVAKEKKVAKARATKEVNRLVRLGVLAKTEDKEPTGRRGRPRTVFTRV